MFFQLALLCSVAACVLAAPSPTNVVPLEKQQPTVIPIVSQSEELEANGTYKYSYETANGIKREEISYDKILPKVEGRSAGSGDGSDSEESNEIHVQQGSYSYVAPDGSVITLRYIADENGFRPIGDHLPKAPVLVQQAQANANEKQGRALNTDNNESGSEAVATAVKISDVATASSEIKPEEAPKEVEVAERANFASGEQVPAASPTSELVKNEASQSTTAVPSEASTTEGAVTSEAASTIVSVLTTESAITTESAATIESASTTESATTTKSAATTESSSTTESAVTLESSSTTQSASTIESASTTESLEASTIAPTADQQASTVAASSSSEVPTTEGTSPSIATA